MASSPSFFLFLVRAHEQNLWRDTHCTFGHVVGFPTGLIVDDEQKAQQLIADYFNPMWENSKSGALYGKDAAMCQACL